MPVHLRSGASAGRVRPALGIRSASLALTASLLCFGAALAQEPAEVVVTGRVVDRATGAPLAGVVVSIPDLEREAVTDTLGNFVLYDVETGTWQATAEQLGYEVAEEVWAVAGNPDPVIISLVASPILLDAITVQADRFRSRRNGVAKSVRAFEQRDLLTTAAPSVRDFVLRRLALSPVKCRGGILSFSEYCVWHRGRPTPLSVYIDEVPAIGGMDQLALYRPHEVFLVEVYGRTHVRVYTKRFIERNARLGTIATIPIFH